MTKKFKEFSYETNSKYEVVKDLCIKKGHSVVEINKENTTWHDSLTDDCFFGDRNLMRDIFDDVLRLPSYCGNNMNSVHDCFYDKSWTRNKKISLLLKDIEEFIELDTLLSLILDIYNHSKKSNFQFEVWIFEDQNKTDVSRIKLIKLLENLRENINELKSGKLSYNEFDEWLVKEYADNSHPKVYLDLISELMSEIEGIQMDMDNLGKKVPLSKVRYSDEFFRKILDYIDKRMKELKNEK